MSIEKSFVSTACTMLLTVCIFAQEYKSERPEKLFDATILPQKNLSFCINPLSNDTNINSFVICEAEYMHRISPKNEVLYNLVSYSITGKGNNGDEIVVYTATYDAITNTNSHELFITEDDVHRVQIPEFAWNGICNQSNASEFLRGDGSSFVRDGEYTLTIGLQRYTDEKIQSEKPYESVADLQKIRIIIDTTPPVIDCELLLVCTDPLTDSYSYVLAPNSTHTSNDDFFADEWHITLNGLPIFKTDTAQTNAEPCPIITFNAVDGDTVHITATDTMKNIATKTIVVTDRLKNISPKEKTRLAYFNAVKLTLLPFCNHAQIDVATLPLRASYPIPKAQRSLIKTYYRTYTPYISFSSNAQQTALIPITLSDDILSFTLYESDVKNGMNYISVSDGAETKFLFGQTEIFSKKIKRRIETKIGFDGRSLLDIPDILFPPSAASFLEDEELYAHNLPVINTTIAIINDNMESLDYVEILGYANPENSEKGAELLEKENEESLLPLSKKRAEYVKTLMELLGIPTELLRVIPCGGTIYEFAPNDKEINYQNRRVRFHLVGK